MPTTSSVPRPLTALSTITTASFNEVFDVLYDVIGVGEDGYGLQDFFSTPISNKTVLKSKDWTNLRIDLVETAYQHITNSSSTWTISMSTGTSITPASHNEAWDLVQYVNDNRYTCHEQQYYRDPITSVSTNTTGGYDVRTNKWDTGVDGPIITHKVRARWPSRLLARYFFNSGGYWTWTPYHENNNILNDLDAGWANFIVDIQTQQNTAPIRYDRASFEAQSADSTVVLYPVGSSSTSGPTYSSGPLSITVSVYKSLNLQYLEFTITFENNETPILAITPAVAYWNEII